MYNSRSYHVDIDACYFTIVRVKYESEDYIKAHIRTFTKYSNTWLADERNVKIDKKNFEFLKRWDTNTELT